MPQVFTVDMVAHVWAQQSQESGRSHNGNFYFEGAKLYSYGPHYVVGVFAAPGGPVFLNSTSSTPTTNGKHRGPAYWAVRHLEPLYLPELEDIADTITRAGRNGGKLPADAPEHHKRNAESYLRQNWHSIPADSQGAAWILRAIGSRAQWPAMRAGLERARDKAKAANAERARKAAAREGRELAALPWPDVRNKAARFADSYGFRELREYVADFRAARLATPKAHKRVRSILWQREQALRAMLKRAKSVGHGWQNGNPADSTKGRAELAKLRQIGTGRLGPVPGFEGPEGPGKLRAALELPTGAGWRALANALRDVLRREAIPLPPAMRERFEALRAMADDIATQREGEESARRSIREARDAIRRELRSFNTTRRHFWRLVEEMEMREAERADSGAAPDWPGTPSPRAVARTAENIHAPSAVPWRAERGLELSPALAARAARIAAAAGREVERIEAAAEPYRTEAERIEAARREAERIEAARIAAMSPAELVAAWERGEIAGRHSAVRALELERGPLLRAVGAEIDGCNVTGGTLETSQGATVPLRHAFRVFQFVALCRAERKAWTPGCGFGPARIRVGHFTLDRIDSTGNFVAGCHSIKWGEVSRLAEALGVAGCLATLPEVTAELGTDA